MAEKRALRPLGSKARLRDASRVIETITQVQERIQAHENDYRYVNDRNVFTAQTESGCSSTPSTKGGGRSMRVAKESLDGEQNRGNIALCVLLQCAQVLKRFNSINNKSVQAG